MLWIALAVGAPVLGAALFYAFQWLSGASDRRDEQARKPRLVRVVRYKCHACEEAMEDSEIVLRRFTAEGAFYTHLRCASPMAIDEALKE